MKGKSEKLYDPSSLDVHFCHAISLCDKHFPIVLKVQILLSRHYGVLFPGQSHLCFPSMSIKTMRHYLSSVHFKFSDLSGCCKKNSRPPKPIWLSLSIVLTIKYSSITCVATHNLTSRQQL